MIIKKRTLLRLIENYLFENEKVGLKNSRIYTGTKGMKGEQLLVKDVKFRWGNYKGEHKNEKYVILDGELELGDIQKKGDPFTYKKTPDGKYKVVSGPAKFDKNIGTIIDNIEGQKMSGPPGPKPPEEKDELINIDEILTYSKLEDLNKLIKERNEKADILTGKKGSIEVEFSNKKKELINWDGEKEVGKGSENSYPKLIPNYNLKHKFKSDIESFNSTMNEIMEITLTMWKEMLDNLSKFFDMGKGIVFDSKKNTSYYMNKCNEYIKSYYYTLYKICWEVGSKINPYWKNVIQTKTNVGRLSDTYFSSTYKKISSLLENISNENDSQKRSDKINTIINTLTDEKILFD